MTLCAVATIYLVVLLLARRGAGVPELAAAAAFLALAPIALGPVSLNTYDALPALLTVGALAALLYGRGTLALGLLGAAFAVKLYALVLVPLALLRLGRAAAWRGLAAFAGVAVVLIVPWVALSPHGVWESVRAQLGRGLHAESLGASVLLAGDRVGAYDAHVVKRLHPAATRDLTGGLPHALGYATSVLALLAVAAVWLVYSRRRDRLELAFAAAIAGVLAFAKVLSPQYLVWLIPFVPFGGVARRRAVRRRARARAELVLPLPAAVGDRLAGLAAAGPERPARGALRRSSCGRRARRRARRRASSPGSGADGRAPPRPGAAPSGRRSSSASRRRPPTSRRRASAG